MEEDPPGERSSIVNQQPGCGSDKPQAVEHASNADRDEPPASALLVHLQGRADSLWYLHYGVA